MSYLFCIEPDDGPSSIADEKRFVKRRVPKSLESSLERAEDEVARLEKSYKMPAVLNVVKWVTLLLGVIICPRLVGLGVSIEQGYRNAPYLYWIGPISLIIGIGLYLIDRTRNKMLRNSGDYRNAVSRLDNLEQVMRKETSVCSDGETIDVLGLFCDSENGEIDHVSPAIALEMTAFNEDDELCLFDGLCVYGFSKDRMSGIRLINDAIPLMNWNKTERLSDAWIKQYGVIDPTRPDKGLRCFYVLDILEDGKTYSIAFPAYELETIEELTGLDAPAAQEYFPHEDERLRPEFYWNKPKDSIKFFSPSADVNFRSRHPVLYIVLAIIAILVLFVPMLLFCILAVSFYGDLNFWALLGVVGGFVFGVGLFNIVAAWLHQYLGHKVTIACLAAGSVLMVISWLLIGS